ncbi:MAG: toprim domain-containing protein [Planctomycetes bacterium]|nr:toprim domain-containing protein [Planctomycetota bacterium]
MPLAHLEPTEVHMNSIEPSGRPQGRRRNIRPRKPDDIEIVETQPKKTGRTFPPIAPEDLPIDILAARLYNFNGDGETFSALCPGHADGKPSLAIRQLANGRILLHCHAGCKPEEVLSAINLDFSHLYPSGYALRNNKGNCKPPGQLAAYVPLDVAEPVINYHRFESLTATARRRAEGKHGKLAKQLGVDPEALVALGVGTLDYGNNWVFPEVDDQFRVVGACFRSRNGKKTFATGGKRGLTIAQDWPRQPTQMYIAEGATDTAALLSVGVNAIGRPAAMPSSLAIRWLIQLLRRDEHPYVIVLGDNDEPKNGVAVGPKAASDLADILGCELGQNIHWALPQPQFKDVRDQIAAGQWKARLVIKGASR